MANAATILSTKKWVYHVALKASSRAGPTPYYIFETQVRSPSE